MKSKVVKRILATSLATVMVAGMAGCGNEQAGGDASVADPSTEESVVVDDADADVESEVEEEVGQYTVRTDADGNVYDLGGMEIIIRDWWSGEPAEPTNAYEEALQEYREWIQETYNFTIKEQGISSWGSVPEDFVNYATTGGEENYIFALYQGGATTSAMNSGLMYDLSTLDCLDFSEEKWSNGIHNMFSKGGSIYAMSGVEPQPRSGMFFNKRLLEEANIDPQSIYDLQESGEWTWAKFEEICAQVHADTDNDGAIDRYALLCVTQDFFAPAVYSNNGDFIAMDENGMYYNDLESEETIEALNWSLDVIAKYQKTFAEDAAWDYAYNAFVNGEGAFIPMQYYKAQEWVDVMEDDFGFVCFPMGPKATDYTNVYEDNLFAIPACYDADKAWKLAFAYDLYTSPVPGYEDYEGWKAQAYKNFKDTESVDLTSSRMMKNGRVTYHTLISGLDLGPDLYWKLNADNTPAQQAEAIRNTWASYLEEANK